MNKIWNVLSDDVSIQRNESISEYILRLRNVTDVRRFIQPSIFDLEPFESMVNINLASDIIIDGIHQNKRFCVYFDVDCDGISSGTIMYKYLQQLKANVTYDINNGKQHGLANRDLTEFKDNMDILIIVDSLDTDYKIYDTLKSYGIEVVILDHHHFSEYPTSATLVSSNKYYGNPALSGSGVTWKVCAYLDKILNTKYAEELIDLCACGILADVCDVSEKSHENRYLCYQGLKNLNNIGLKAILDKYDFNAQAVLWSIAPLINASQRTQNNLLAVKLFLTNDEKVAKIIVKDIKKLKDGQDCEVIRQSDLVREQQKTFPIKYDKFVYGFIETGELTGLIATQISNEFQLPALIFKDSVKDIPRVYGSGRSPTGLNLRSVIESLGYINVGGHEQAFGINLAKVDFVRFLKDLYAKLCDYSFETVINIDCKLSINNITNKMIHDIEKINYISGAGFKPITFMIENVEVEKLMLMQNKHTKFESNGIEFICWKNSILYKVLKCEDDCVRYATVCGNLQLNNFAGKVRQQFIISDFFDVWEEDKFIF